MDMIVQVAEHDFQRGVQAEAGLEGAYNEGEENFLQDGDGRLVQDLSLECIPNLPSMAQDCHSLGKSNVRQRVKIHSQL